MTPSPLSVRIPVMKISGKASREEEPSGMPRGLIRISEVEISQRPNLPQQCYALEVPLIGNEPAGESHALGIFGLGEAGKAYKEIYLLGWAEKEPRICKVVKDDSHTLSPDMKKGLNPTDSSRVNSRRKSFMTPTPLHIPESRVSPIPDSAHQMIFLKCLDDPKDSVLVVPLREVVWMHPLVTLIVPQAGSLPPLFQD